MKMKEIVKKAQELKAKRARLRADARYKKVVGFLKAKGLLVDAITVPRPNVKLDVEDVLWVGEKIEPRVLEVFPAAFIHFRKTFLNTDAMPENLRTIIEAIRLRRGGPKDYKGIEFAKMKHWAEIPLKDLRVKPLTERKIPKNFRLTPKAIESLRLKAQRSSVSETELLERLILQE